VVGLLTCDFVKGNTCFMNSTLQCLAHTDPLRRYFLSGEYEKDLNRDNPLGTGGDMATEFATLLAEMWGTAAPSSGRKIETSSYVSSASSVVYPRDFKFTLGKHAEQFVGYDQHDSQELATYLLDALHEDTNRVTKKPYVEKAEQGEDEPDDVAAKKAWDLHLKREDSRVLENFMGQVKSRVQCCKEGCGRVSTTFDPFMYLSVPIPGSMDRTMRVTFVPLDGKIRKKDLSVTLNRAATIGKLATKVIEQLTKAGFSFQPGRYVCV
jgi:ubiquitin C-terminal hydrolase